MTGDQIEKDGDTRPYPATHQKIEKRNIDTTLFPKPKDRTILVRLYDATESLLGVIGKLIFVVIVASIAIWVYPDGFLDTPFASITFKAFFEFLASLLFWVVALAVFLSIF